MSNIEAMMQVDFRSLIVTIFVVIFGFIAIVEAVGKISEYIGRPVGWIKRRQADHDLIMGTSAELAELKRQHEESVRQSIKHDQMIKSDLNNIALKVASISSKLDVMQEKNDKAELAKMRDLLLRYYNKYKNSDGWSSLEKETFESILSQYEARNGDGFIHTTVKPVMDGLKITD